MLFEMVGKLLRSLAGNRQLSERKAVLEGGAADHLQLQIKPVGGGVVVGAVGQVWGGGQHAQRTAEPLIAVHVGRVGGPSGQRFFVMAGRVERLAALQVG